MPMNYEFAFKKDADDTVKVLGIVTSGPYTFFPIADQVTLIKAFTSEIPYLELQRIFKTKRRGDEPNKKFREAVAFAKESGTNLIIMTSMTFNGVCMSLLLNTMKELSQLEKPIKFYFLEEDILAGDPENDTAIFCEQVFYGMYEEKEKHREKMGNKILKYLGAFDKKAEELTEGSN